MGDAHFGEASSRFGLQAKGGNCDFVDSFSFMCQFFLSVLQENTKTNSMFFWFCRCLSFFFGLFQVPLLVIVFAPVKTHGMRRSMVIPGFWTQKHRHWDLNKKDDEWV